MNYDSIRLSELDLFERMADIHFLRERHDFTIHEIWEYIGSTWNINTNDDLSQLKLTEGVIRDALERNDWIQKDASRELEITPRAMTYHVSKFGITHTRWKTNVPE